VYRNGGEIARFSQSNRSTGKEKFAVRQDDFKPILIQEGEIQRRVLDFCDSKRNMREIAEMLLAEFPGEYMDIREAFEAVARILLGKVKI
jgi:hypothetical protein